MAKKIKRIETGEVMPGSAGPGPSAAIQQMLNNFPWDETEDPDNQQPQPEASVAAYILESAKAIADDFLGNLTVDVIDAKNNEIIFIVNPANHPLVQARLDTGYTTESRCDVFDVLAGTFAYIFHNTAMYPYLEKLREVLVALMPAQVQKYYVECEVCHGMGRNEGEEENAEESTEAPASPAPGMEILPTILVEKWKEVLPQYISIECFAVETAAIIMPGPTMRVGDDVQAEIEANKVAVTDDSLETTTEAARIAEMEEETDKESVQIKVTLAERTHEHHHKCSVCGYQSV